MTSDTMKVDWAQPLEAVHEDGRVVAVDKRDTSKATDYQWWVQIEGKPFLVVARDGFTGIGWTIRNKPAAAVAPVGGDEEWGPAIEVGGVRPEWLGDDDNQVVAYNRSVSNHWFGFNGGELTFYVRDIENAGGDDGWSDVTAIRLPANHPHYRTEKTAEAPLGVLTGVEALERYEGFLRRLASGLVGNAEAVAEAKALLPVDPDLLKAREICAVIAEGMSDDGLAIEYRRGDLDEQFEMRAALAGLRSPASDHRSK